MAKNKTAETEVIVDDFIASVPDEKKRADSKRITEIMTEVTGFQPKMWGPSIVGFGSYHYRYESGHEGDAPLVGFSPRKDTISLYLASDFEKKESLLEKLGKHKAAKACIYIKKLDDVDLSVFKEMIALSVTYLKNRYPLQ
ncbi:DUF1801 domain-containing protein [Dyadobacter sp. 32]|uniref:DUF1801 domain-containing protein n=1 Tax=Dyadobacter sp. 32 TaxID=538966 RepID=UPI0011ED69C7